MSEEPPVTQPRRLTTAERNDRFKEILNLVLQLKDAAFKANEAGLRWSNDMANAAFKMRTALSQLPQGTLPAQVHEYATAHAPQVIGAWQNAYHQVEQALLADSR